MNNKELNLYHRILRKVMPKKKWNEYWTEYCRQEICRRVQTIGPEALQKFSTIAKEFNAEYSLMYGTLLGSYREHGFIKHDDDIDITVRRQCMTKELISCLQDKGFRFQWAFHTDDKTRLHVAFDYEGVKFDLYSYVVDEEKGVATSCVPRVIDGGWPATVEQKKARVLNMSFPYKGLHEIIFEGVRVKAWSNADEVLRINYGDDFMTPIRGAKAKANENIWIDDLSIRYFRMQTWTELSEEL